MLRRFWLEGLAVAVAVLCLLRTAVLGSWSRDYPELLFAALGLLSVLFSEEVALTTGRYGWTRSQWWQDPDDWVKWTGAFTLLAAALRLFFTA